MTNQSTIRVEGGPAPLGAYPHAKRAGDMLFISGVGPRRPGRNDIPGVALNEKGQMISVDVAAQCRSCFENVQSILEASGGRMEQIVDVLSFLTDMERDFATYNEIYAEFFAGDGKPNPARTTVEVSRLPQGGSAPICVELKVVAWLGS